MTDWTDPVELVADEVLADLTYEVNGQVKPIPGENVRVEFSAADLTSLIRGVATEAARIALAQRGPTADGSFDVVKVDYSYLAAVGMDVDDEPMKAWAEAVHVDFTTTAYLVAGKSGRVVAVVYRLDGDGRRYWDPFVGGWADAVVEHVEIDTTLHRLPVPMPWDRNPDPAVSGS